jgi:hypothetical protein
VINITIKYLQSSNVSAEKESEESLSFLHESMECMRTKKTKTKK